MSIPSGSGSYTPLISDEGKERMFASLSTAELQSIDYFNGTNKSQDARRWWAVLEYSLESTIGDRNYPKRLVKLFDVKLSGDAAQWADETPEVSDIIQAANITESDIEELKKLFLSRFRKTLATRNDVDKDLEDLKQLPAEKLSDYYIRARRLLVRICEDSTVEGSPRVMTKAESQWIKTVITRFTKGMIERWIGFQVEESEPRGLEEAYKKAKDLTRKQEKLKEMSIEWSRDGYTVPQLGPNMTGSNLAFSPTDLHPNHQNNLGRSYNSDPQRGYNPRIGSNQYQTRPYNQNAYGNPINRGYASDPHPNNVGYGTYQRNNAHIPPMQAKAVEQRLNDIPKPPTIQNQAPLQQSTYRNNQVPQPPGKSQQDLKSSSNPYINGTTVYTMDPKRPLCVSCGNIGHYSHKCNGKTLESWEREHLRSLVFPSVYFNSRSARLFRSGYQLTEEEAKVDDEKHYKAAGYSAEIEEPKKATNEVQSRLSWLESNPQKDRIISSRVTHADGTTTAEPEGRPIKPLKTMKMQDVLKRKDRSDSSSQDKPSRKKEKGPENTHKDKPRKPRKKVADMTPEEREEREIRKNEKKQLKTIRGMAGRQRFDLAKALSETPCPISYLQYLQDSPIARLEMGRINQLTSSVLAAMFGDRVNARASALEDKSNELPNFGSGGAFMVSARITNTEVLGPPLHSKKVCIDSGSEIDLATPAVIDRTKADVIDIRDTPWPNLCVRTSAGSSMKLIAIARIKVLLQGGERTVYCCVIPEHCAKNTGYDLLLGIPWLYDVRAIHEIADGSMTIYSNTPERTKLINSEKFTPPNFKVMFDGYIPRRNHSSDSESSEESSEEEVSNSNTDSGEESIKSSDGTPTDKKGKKPIRKYTYDEIIKPYSRKTTLSSRCTTLILEGESEEKRSIEEVARIRYISPTDYLEVYGNEGRYSHLAEGTKDLQPLMEDEKGNAIDGEDQVMLIIDDENRWHGSTHEATEDDQLKDFQMGETPLN